MEQSEQPEINHVLAEYADTKRLFGLWNQLSAIPSLQAMEWQRERT